MAAFPPFSSDSSPFCALRRVNDLDAARLQLVADAIGLRPVFLLLGGGTRGDERVDLGILFLLGLRLALLLRGREQVQTEHLIEFGKRGALCCVVRLGLEDVIERRDRKGRVEVAVQRSFEAFAQRVQRGLLERCVLRVERGDLCDQLLIGQRRIVQILP